MTEAASPPAQIPYEQRYASQALDAAIERGESDILIRGPRGVGKTIDLCDRWHRMALKYPGMVQIWLRESRARLTDSVLGTFEDEILGGGHPLIAGQNREHRHAYQYPNGSRIILQGLDDPERQKSVSADLIWVNEPTEISEDQWEEIGASNRPRMRSTCPIRLQLGDFNPVGPGHWTNKRCALPPMHLFPNVLDDGGRMGEWFTPAMYAAMTEYNLTPQNKALDKSKLIIWTHPDNPGYWSLDPWGWTPPGLEYVTTKLGRMAPHRKRRYLAGIPSTPSGVVFPSFNRDRHVVGRFPKGIPADWPAYLAEDPGFDHPTAIAVAVVAPNGRRYYCGEFVRSETEVKDDAAWITQFTREHRLAIRKKLGDPHYMFSANKHNNGVTVAQQMRALGHQFEQAVAANNSADLDAQVQLIRTGLDTLLADGFPAIQFIGEDCPNLVNAMESHPFKRNARGERTGAHDEYSEMFKDEIDAIRMIEAERPKYVQESGWTFK